MFVYNLFITLGGESMFGTLVNTGAIIIGGSLGLLFRKGIPSKLSDTIMNGLALCVLYIGFTGALKGENALIVIFSMVIGAIIGECLDLDKRVNDLGIWMEKKFKKNDSKVSISEGFVTASLLFCVGAMAIIGSLQDGLTGNSDMLLTKSMLDGVSSIVFASTLGVGVILSSAFVFTYQGSITLLAGILAPFLTDSVINEMTCVGSLLIIALGLNVLKVTNIKIMNLVPAIFIPILLGLFL